MLVERAALTRYSTMGTLSDGIQKPVCVLFFWSEIHGKTVKPWKRTCLSDFIDHPQVVCEWKNIFLRALDTTNCAYAPPGLTWVSAGPAYRR